MAGPGAKNELAQRVLEELSSFGLLAIPEQYVVWYRYLEGHDRALADEISERLSQNHAITSQFLLGLFDKYCFRDDQQRDHLGTAMQSLETDSSGLLGLAHSMSGTVGAFGADIKSAVVSLMHGEPSESDLRSVIQALVETATKTNEQNQVLQQKVESVVENISATRSFLEQIEESVEKDVLTKLNNRRRFNYLLQDNVALAGAEKTPLCLIVCNLDGFKRFNFAYGYQAGDQVLVHVANMLKRSTKGGDILARLHGDEFAIALPQTTLSDALKVAEKLRASFENFTFSSRSTGKDMGQITLAFGVAALRPDVVHDAFLDQACACLDEAKAKGGNNVFSGAPTESDDRALTDHSEDVAIKINAP